MTRTGLLLRQERGREKQSERESVVPPRREEGWASEDLVRVRVRIRVRVRVTVRVRVSLECLSVALDWC